MPTYMKNIFNLFYIDCKYFIVLCLPYGIDGRYC